MNIYLELFGYLGTALVIISMMMTSVTKLRIFNIAGSVISMIYSFCVQAYPVVLLNACLAVINLVHLIRGHLKRMKAQERSSHETEA